MEEIMAANAVEETVVETAPTEGEIAIPETHEEEVTKTQAFSRRLNEMSDRKVDDFVSSLGFSNDITGEPIKTRSDYETYIKMRDAQAQGKDPVTSVKLSEMEGRLSRYMVNEQDAALKNDPEKAEVYGMVRDEVLDLVKYCHDKGDTNVTVDSAFQVILSKNAGKLFTNIKKNASAAAVKQVSDAAKASPGKLSGGDVPNAIDYSSMSKADFEKQVALAKSGKLRAK